MLKKLDISDWLVIGLVGFHLLVNAIWITLNSVPLPWDQAGHTLLAFDFLRYFKGESAVGFLNISDYYPPLVHILVAGGMFLFGKSAAVGQIVISLFFVLSIIFLYLYSNKLFKNKTLSFIAALLFSILPTVYALSRWFLLEIPQTAFILGSLYFLEESNRLSKIKPAILFAIFSAFAILTKWTALAYLVVPVLFKVNWRTKGPQLRIMLLAIAVIATLAVPWYLVNLRNIAELTQITATAEVGDPQNIFSIQNIAFYLSLLANFQLIILGFLLFALSSIIFIYYKRRRSLLIAATIFFAYFVFTFIPNKNIRYTVPLLPFITIVISYALCRIINLRKKMGILLTLLISAYYLFYFFSLSFGFPVDPEKVNYQRAIKLPILGWIDYINFGKNTSRYLAPKFDNKQWPNETIFNDVRLFINDRKQNILFLVDKENINISNLKVIQEQKGFSNIRFETPYTIAFFKRNEDVKRYIAFFDMALVAQNSFGPKGAMRHNRTLKQLKEYIESQNKEQARILRKYKLPDGDIVYLYKLSI